MTILYPLSHSDGSSPPTSMDPTTLVEAQGVQVYHKVLYLALSCVLMTLIAFSFLLIISSNVSFLGLDYLVGYKEATFVNYL